MHEIICPHCKKAFKIESQKFYLINLERGYKLQGNIPILADWFIGTLRIAQGKMLHCVHAGLASVFEHELHIKIERGDVVGVQTIDNRGL